MSKDEYKNSFDEVWIRSGGDIPLYKTDSRTTSLTIRHDSGYAADVSLRKGGNNLKIRTAADIALKAQVKGKDWSLKIHKRQILENEVIWAFLKACKELGVTGIGADYDYDKGICFHIDIAKENPDFKTDIYKRSFTIQGRNNLRKKNKDGKIVVDKTKILRSINSITSVRYWGKNEGGSYKKEAAPEILKKIFD